MECDTDLSKYSYDNKIKPFSHMKNTLIASNQPYKYALQHISLFHSGIKLLNFKISYECNNKKYSDSFYINLESFSDSIQNYLLKIIKN